MAYDKEKLSRFENSVLSETQEKVDSLKQEAESYKKSELEKSKQMEYERIFTQMQAQVRNLQWKYRQMVTKASLDAKRNTLVTRNELAEKIFNEVRKRLLAFANSKEYASYLLEHLEKASKEFSCKDAVLLLRQEDLSYADQAKKVVPVQSVEADKTNLLGGFKIVNRKTGLLLDETFQSSLLDQQQFFYQNCGLTVAE